MAANTPKASTLYKDYTNINKKKPSSFKYDDKNLKNYYDKLMNRKDFSFDLNGNALYQQYKDQFTKQGQMAMMDTMGQASALTGGYGNSYAQTAGQQVYQQNLSQLTDKIPELYQLAMNQYQMEGDNLQNLYGVAANERDYAYGQYRDKVSDWYNDRNFSYDAYTNQRDYERQLSRDKVADTQWAKEFGLENDKFNWQKTMDNKNYNLDLSRFNWDKTMDTKNYNLDVDKFNESKRQYNQTFDYNKSRDTVADSQWQKEFAENQRQYNQNYAYNRQRDAVADSQWQQSFNYNKSNDAANRQLDQQRLNETIRSNKASEKLAAEKNSSSSSGSSGSKLKQSKKVVKSPQDFVNPYAATLYHQMAQVSKTDRIEYINEAFINEKINEREYEYLYELYGDSNK